MVNKIGYLREIRIAGRIGRIYPVSEVKIPGHKVEIKSKEHSG